MDRENICREIAVIPGDGIGKEITNSAVKVLAKVDEKYNLNLKFSYYDAGGTAYDKYHTPLPKETIDGAKKADAVLFGAVGGPKWDNVETRFRPEKAVLGLRKELGLYANLRPIKVADSLVEYSPLKAEIVQGTDILIVRELIGGIYFGEKCESEIIEGKEWAWDKENYSVPEVERIVEFAVKSAKQRKAKVTSVDKANVLATSRLWRKVATNVAKKYSDVKLEHLYVDNCAMQLAINPKQFDVIVTGNLFGDILSDEAAVLSGSIGMLPSASIGKYTSLYEPIHGSAPDIAGKGIANPIATILSASMLLRYSLEENQAANCIEQAVEKTLAQGYRTLDLYKDGFIKVDTESLTSLIIKNI